MTDTSKDLTAPEHVERLAQDCARMQRDHDRETEEARHHHDTAATLRALSAALLSVCQREAEMIARYDAKLDAAEVRLKTAKVRAALRTLEKGK